MKQWVLILALISCSFAFSNVLFAQTGTSRGSIKSDTRKNSVYAELGGTGPLWSINYDRIFPVAHNLGIVVRGGFSWEHEFNLLGELDLLIGGPRHFLELGHGRYAIFSRFDPATRIGYRLQTSNGITLRVAFIHIPVEFIEYWAGLSIGYSF